MRISLWPALVCGSMLAATVGNALVAAPPAGKPSRAIIQADSDDDESDDGEEMADETESSIGRNSYQPIQYVPGGPGPSDGAGLAPPLVPAFDPALTAPNAWPETSP
ncbi:MAG TPA: hypothetical protein VGH74_20145, partial [Planctomycetaceae bacterium]